jgi:hypothetical protein
VLKRYLKPQSHEIAIIGKWISKQGVVKADEACNRIEQLKSNYLRKIADSKEHGGWMVLYQDPQDMRYWELSYPQSELHGGGPPALTIISEKEARMKYKF